MMENVKITKCEPILEGKALGIELADGRKATAWADKIDAPVLMNYFMLGGVCALEMKPYKSKAGKEGLNIVEIGLATGQQPLQGIEVNPSLNKPVPAMTNASGMVEVAKEISQVPSPKPEDFHDADEFSVNAKSSVKLTKNTKGLNWEIKVVTGEIGLIDALGKAAIEMHNVLCEKYPVSEKPEA